MIITWLLIDVWNDISIRSLVFVYPMSNLPRSSVSFLPSIVISCTIGLTHTKLVNIWIILFVLFQHKVCMFVGWKSFPQLCYLRIHLWPTVFIWFGGALPGGLKGPHKDNMPLNFSTLARTSRSLAHSTTQQQQQKYNRKNK